MEVEMNNLEMNSLYSARKLCRACLNDHEDMQDIYQTCISDVFAYCTSLEVSVNDGLPPALCRNCITLLNTLYYFKQQCIRSDETLRQIMIPQVSGNIKEEEGMLDLNDDMKYELNPHPVPVPVPVPVAQPIFQVEEDECSTLGDDFIYNDNDNSLLNDHKETECELANLNPDIPQLIDITEKVNENILEASIENKSIYNIPDAEVNVSEDLSVFSCKICCEVFYKDSSLRNHVREMHSDGSKRSKYKVNPKDDLLTKCKSKTEIKTSLFKCPKCDKQFKMAHRLDAHIRQHYGLKPFDCKNCHKEFSNWRTWKMHMNRHSGQKSYVCNICKKVFAYPTALEIHKKIHLGIKKFSCPLCNACFVQSGQLKSHMRTHSSEKPFECSQCGRCFKSNSILKSHMDRHKGVRNFVCSICGKRFPTNGELTTHIQSHTNDKPFCCSVCNKNFRTRSLLTVHNRKHTGDRPYKCSMCPKQFMESQVLKRHIVVHADVKPHICDICHRGFGQKCSLKKHLKSHEQILQGVCYENL